MRKALTHAVEKEDLKGRSSVSVQEILTHVFQLSRREISRLKFSDDGLMCGTRKLYIHDGLKEGEILTAVFPEEETETVSAGGYQPVFLYRDEDLLIVDKPAGMPVHPSHGHLEDSLGTALAACTKEGSVIRPVGRLDRDVSGVMVYAGSQAAAARLNRQRQNGEMKKIYLAAVQGVFSEDDGEISLPIAKAETEQKRKISASGRDAVTHYHVLQEKMLGQMPVSVLEVTIETGRTHQIRVHFSSLGYPLLGDALYGGNMDWIQRPALHCRQVTLIQPFTQETIQAESPLPADMLFLR